MCRILSGYSLSTLLVLVLLFCVCHLFAFVVLCGITRLFHLFENSPTVILDMIVRLQVIIAIL